MIKTKYKMKELNRWSVKNQHRPIQKYIFLSLLHEMYKQVNTILQKIYISNIQEGVLSLDVSFISGKDEGDFKTTAEGLIK